MTPRDRLGTNELMIMLAILRLGDDAYGVTIARELRSALKQDVLIGSVYATLDRLEAKGSVSSFLGEPSSVRGGRAKRFFQVTAKGSRETKAARRALSHLTEGLSQVREGLV